MSVNTVLTAEVTPTNATYAANPNVANQSLVYWFNDAAPNNSLVFAGLGSLVSFWRGDFRNGGSFTESNRQGQFRQTNDITSSDLQFFFSSGVGYLLTAGDRGNVWCYAFDPSTVVGGCAVIQVDAGTTSANLLADSTTLDLNNGNGTFQTAPTVGDTFTIAGRAQSYTLNAASIITLTGTIAVGSEPSKILYVPTSDRIYVPNESNNNVSVINPSTNAVVATIIAGSGSRGVGYAPTTDRIYVANRYANNVSVINRSTNAVVATITVGAGPYDVAYAPTSDRIYVTNNSVGTVSVINPSTNVVVATITVGNDPAGLAYVPTSDRIYVPNESSNNVSVINPSTNAVVTTIIAGSGSRSVGYVPTTDRIYVTNGSVGTVSVINPSTNVVVATITVGAGPLDVAYALTSDRIYVTNGNARNVSVINPVTNAVVATITVGDGPRGVGYVPTTDRIYVVNFSNNNVSVINPRTNLIDAGTRARVTFEPGLTNAVAVGDALQFWGAGNKFVSARLRLASVAFPSAARLSTDLANGFASIRNTSTATFYRDLILANFNGTSSVTVNGTSIAPNTGASIGYYNISTPVFSINVTARDLDFYYKAGTSYLIATSTTNQLFLYAFDAATVSSAPAVKATFTTNGLSASTPRHLSFIKVGSDLVLLVVGDTINLLYRFPDNIFDGTGTITINGQSIAHSSGYAVPTSAALFYWLHNTTATDSLLGALYHNTVANRTVIAFVTTAGVNVYELNLAAFDGTATVTVKGTQVAPTSRQYTLPEYLSSFQIPSYTAPLALSYSSTDATNSFISDNTSRIARLGSFNRFNTVIDLLTQSYTAAPAITKTSANGALTLSTAITAFQALSILVIGASLISLRNSDGTTGYANGEFYPYAYTATGDAEGTINEGFTLSGATAAITGTYRFTMASGTTLTLSGKATYNDSFTVPSGATLAIAQNTTIGTSLILQAGATVARAAGATGNYTLTLAVPTPGLIAGTGITILSPPIIFSGFPTANNANAVAPAPKFGLYSAINDAWTFYDVSSGSVSVSLSTVGPDSSFLAVTDAIGWIRPPAQTIQATRSDNFSWADLYQEFTAEDGTPIIDTIPDPLPLSYDQTNNRFELKSGETLTFAEVAATKEALTSSETGIQAFDTATLRGIQFISNSAYRRIILPNAFTVAMQADATAGAILIDFLLLREGATPGTYADPFAHGLASTASGLTDRPEVVTAFQNATFVGLSASEIRAALGLASANVDTQLSAISSKTTNLPASFPVVDDSGRVTVGTLNNNVITANAIAADAVAEIQNGLATASSIYTTAQIATAVEAALIAEGDGQKLLEAIQGAVQQLFDTGTDVPIATLVGAIADRITADHGTGSYTTANLSAVALQATLEAVQTKTNALPDDPADQSELAQLIAAIPQGLTTQQNTRLTQLWQQAGFDSAVPVVRDKEGDVITETIGTTVITHTATNDGDTVTTERQP